MNGFLDFLKSLLREPSVRALLIGLVVNGLVYLVGLIPNPPAWLSEALLALVQQIALFIEAIIVGWAASDIKAIVKGYLFLN